jgi:riboflavin synthase
VLEDVRPGDSVAVDGCCLTAVGIGAGAFTVEVVPETLARTTLGGWREGRAVHLERSLRVDQRLGGHLVQGHVDGVGEVVTAVAEGDGQRVRIALPPALSRYVAEKGSIAVDGISLTVARAGAADFEVALVPHTLAVTDAAAWTPGRRVNLEVDLIARYLARLIDDAGLPGRAAS